MQLKRSALILAVLASLALPAAADAHHALHHKHHAQSRHQAHRANVTGCEVPGEPTWTEWRRGMLEAGFTQPETEGLEICAED
jgi:hypothetical protein